jgi:hypothetical protein
MVASLSGGTPPLNASRVPASLASLAVPKNISPNKVVAIGNSPVRPFLAHCALGRAGPVALPSASGDVCPGHSGVGAQKVREREPSRAVLRRMRRRRDSVADEAVTGELLSGEQFSLPAGKICRKPRFWAIGHRLERRKIPTPRRLLIRYPTEQSRESYSPSREEAWR